MSFNAGNGGRLPECIACGDQHLEIVLDKPEADFGEISTLSNSVDANERDAVGKPLLV
jgi:hypothetical protein